MNETGLRKTMRYETRWAHVVQPPIFGLPTPLSDDFHTVGGVAQDLQSHFASATNFLTRSVKRRGLVIQLSVNRASYLSWSRTGTYTHYPVVYLIIKGRW